MFGKRASTFPASPSPLPVGASPLPAAADTPPGPDGRAAAAPQPVTGGTVPPQAFRQSLKSPVADVADPEPSKLSRLGFNAGEPEFVDAAGVTRSQEYYRVKTDVFNALMETIDLSQLAKTEDEQAREEIRDIVSEIVSIKNVILPGNEQDVLLDDICNDILGYGPLEPLLARDDISDIMVNGAGTVYIEVDGKIQRSRIHFQDNSQLMNICQRIVSQVGRRVDESKPICDARLLDGSRVNVIAPPLAIDGPTLTIRKFKKSRLSIEDLVGLETINAPGADVLRIIAASRCNILISGGTGSGKTTLLNCLTAFISPGERIVTCEDAAELQLQQPHVVRLETRPPNLEDQGEVTMRDLVRNCLRMRPDRIVVGEVRGGEALDLIQAMNTGHDGTMGTVHANSTREALTRMESMIAMSGFSLSPRSVREMVVDAVDVVIQASRMRDGRRRITAISETAGMEGDVIITQDIIRFDVEGENEQGQLIGSHRGTGIARPRFGEKARHFNLDRELAAALDKLETD